MPWIVFQAILIMFGLLRLVGSIVLNIFLVGLVWPWVGIIIIKNSKKIHTCKYFQQKKNKDSLQTLLEIIIALIGGYMFFCIMALR